MKKILALASLLMVTACAMPIVQPQIVTVDKPVISCPIPPTIPPISLYTKKLKASDVKNPGKVVQYYKADIVQLYEQNQQLRTILNQYKSLSVVKPATITSSSTK